MVFAIDIGNTNIKMGLFDGEELLDSWRMGTSLSRTSDEYGLSVLDFFHRGGYDVKAVTGIIIASVLPNLNYTFERLCKYYFDLKPLFVGPGIKTGIALKYDNPRELGADRIADSVAAYSLYGGPLTVIDFGTATTFNVIDGEGNFLGGLIAPGLRSSSDALTQNAAKLPKFEFDPPKKVTNKSTLTNLQAGIVYSAVGMTEYICRRIADENDWDDMVVVATGGLSDLVSGETDVIDRIDKTLTLTGLRLIYEINQKKEKV